MADETTKTGTENQQSGTDNQQETPTVEELMAQLAAERAEKEKYKNASNKASSEAAEYKKQLDIRQILSVTVDSVKYGIVSAIGDRKTGNVKVTLMALNLGQDAYPGILHGASFNDYDGNIYMCHDDSVSVGGLSNYEVLRHNINTKITMMFTGVPVNTRISNISSYGGGGATYFSLRDIKIDWK